MTSMSNIREISNLDCESAWDTIQHDLPELKREVGQILKNNDVS